MKAYMTAWRGAIEPSDKTGIATFTCGDREVKFKLNDFQQYLGLCELIDDVAKKAEDQAKMRRG
jgi:hypothetical protein